MDLPPVLLFLNIGTGEIAWLIVLFVLLFGAQKIPELARSLGKAQREFQRAREDIASETTPTDDSEADRIRRAATDLGLPTAGRTTDELKVAIAERLRPS